MGSRAQGRSDFISRLQGQYNADVEVKAEKEKKKEDERRRERIAKCERMGIGLGTRLGSDNGTGHGSSPRSLQGQALGQGSSLDRMQAKYNADRDARELKMQEEAAAKRLEQLSLQIEKTKINETREDENANSGRLGSADKSLSMEEARRRRVAQLQDQYRPRQT